MKLLITGLLCILVTSMCYTTGAFCFWTWNAGRWPEEARGVCAFCAIIVNCATVGISYIDTTKFAV